MYPKFKPGDLVVIKEGAWNSEYVGKVHRVLEMPEWDYSKGYRENTDVWVKQHELYGNDVWPYGWCCSLRYVEHLEEAANAS